VEIGAGKNPPGEGEKALPEGFVVAEIFAYFAAHQDSRSLLLDFASTAKKYNMNFEI
jgi:hypothetical protein